MLDAGQKAPAFTLPNHEGETVRLSDYDGQHVVLYFYPQADTPGCTREACSFRDAWHRFEEQEVTVIGVSDDSLEDIKAFKEKYDLPFELLSDEDGEVATAYESYGTTSVESETRDIIRRNTYVIDETGVIKRVYEDVSPNSHAQKIIDDLS
ncbi:thioredoxin-dependent thiol peroxidase [Halocatena salina]|uniref:thioredoxin-dependent peroxiredoxin n=1 Tax=Halocatena salina TaxID=2934340 RepID=A0A8U0AB32_9EURY|nr:thioredoxin-dependent thiol peroxidase [Halocatena salina]UPM44987.1 thioredoxin-dependent thiol peroxidase [Halocatena salina]